MAKFVVFSAGGSAAVAPAVHLYESRTGTASALVILEAVVLPLVLLAIGVCLLRPGPFKERFVIVTLLIPVTVALGFALWWLGLMAYSLTPGNPLGPGANLVAVAETSLIVLILGSAFSYLVSLWRDRRGVGPHRTGAGGERAALENS